MYSRWGAILLVAAVCGASGGSGASHDICQRLAEDNFDAEWASVFADSIGGKFQQLQYAQDHMTMDGMTAECLTNPFLYLIVSAIWRQPDDEGGREFSLSCIRTARRLASSLEPPQRAAALANVGARLLMSDMWQEGHACSGIKLVHTALVLHPAYLPAHTILRELAKSYLKYTQTHTQTCTETHRPHSSNAINCLGGSTDLCIDKVLSRVSLDTVDHVFVPCTHLDERDGAPKVFFSIGSVSLGYVGWNHRGGRNECNSGDTFSQSFVLRRLRAIDQQEKARSRDIGRAPLPPVMIDVGAGVGEFSLLAAHHDMRVHAFEPGPKPRRELERNVARNGLEARVSLEPLAVGHKEGVAILHADRMSHGHGSIAPTAGEGEGSGG